MHIYTYIYIKYIHILTLYTFFRDFVYIYIINKKKFLKKFCLILRMSFR